MQDSQQNISTSNPEPHIKKNTSLPHEVYPINVRLV